MRTTLRMLVPVLALLGAACQKSAAPSAAPPVAVVADAGAIAARPEGTSEEACLDRWLESQGLDSYGSPAGTMYAGGSPLFDERTGESKDRLTFVYARHPAAKQACRAAAP